MFYVEVKAQVPDIEDPVIIDTPSNIDQFTDPGKPTANVTWTIPSASDNSGTVSLTSTHTPPFDFPIGTTEVIFTATDPSSNTATTSFWVTIRGKRQQK